jgi:hypothetical protein
MARLAGMLTIVWQALLAYNENKALEKLVILVVAEQI